MHICLKQQDNYIKLVTVHKESLISNEYVNEINLNKIFILWHHSWFFITKLRQNLNILADEFILKIYIKKGAKKCFFFMNFPDVKDMFFKCIFW